MTATLEILGWFGLITVYSGAVCLVAGWWHGIVLF